MSPIDSPSISVVLPCLNEAASVGSAVRGAARALQDWPSPWEIVVVDNGSEDDSVALATEAGARVVIEPQRGYGSALRRGFAESTGAVLVMADADCTYEFQKIPELVQIVAQDRADIAIGARHLMASNDAMPFLHRYVGTPTLNRLLKRHIAGNEISDSQSGFRAFRKDTIDHLDLRSQGMELASEMLVKAGRAQLKLEEIPTRYSNRVGDSKLRTFRDGWRHLWFFMLHNPELTLIRPGMVSCFAGLLLTALAIAGEGTVGIGSGRWQPVFFCSTAIMVGAQSAFLGMVAAYTSPVAPISVRQRYAFIGSSRFRLWALRTGLTLAALGLGIDLFLAANSHGQAAAIELAWAGTAQGLILVGCTTVIAILLLRMLDPEGNKLERPEPHPAGLPSL